MDATVATQEDEVFTDAFFQDPYPTYRHYREIDPALPLTFNLNLEQSQTLAGTDERTWFLTGHQAVFDALRDHDAFSSALPSPDGATLTEAEQGRLVLINSDPPRHTALRSIVNRAFTVARVTSLEPMMRQLAEDLVAAVPRGEATDLMPALCEPLPITVIATLLGIPPELRADFKRWSDAMVASADPATLDDNLGQITAMHEYFGAEVSARRSAPGGDLISLLVASDLADWEAVSFCVLLLLAGNETTRSLLGCLLAVLSEQPDLWDALKADRSLVDAAVEEALRYDSPVQVLNRWTKREVELHGHQLPAFANVAVAYAAANRDPSVFPEPDRFRLDRPAERHVAFGLGAHFCLGAPLARAEARLTLEVLLDRVERLERSSAPVRFQSASRVVRGPVTLPLVLS
ncbi:MAG: cypA2 [Actinomycetia bacterium]|nr:cypA2 [Actinomycetes bacterium]